MNYLSISFILEYACYTNSRNDTTYYRNSNQNIIFISSEKTDLHHDTSDNEPDKVCPIPKTNHSLNQFQTKRLDNRRNRFKEMWSMR